MRPTETIRLRRPVRVDLVAANRHSARRRGKPALGLRLRALLPRL